MATYTSNYGWTKPSGSDNVDISVLNNNLDGQDGVIHDAFLNMAPPFSESSTYAVDAIVLYNTGLYKCHTAVVTPGSWTGSTNWQVYKLSEGGGGGLTLGETSSTAYRGDRGKVAYDHSQTTGNPHGTTKGDVGLGNVPNVSTNNQEPTFTEASTRNNIASGEKLSVILGKVQKFFNDLKTVAFSGSYTDLTNTPTIPTTASGISYDNTDSGLSATDVQGAVDELRQADNIMMSDGVTSAEEALDGAAKKAEAATDITMTPSSGITIQSSRIMKMDKLVIAQLKIKWSTPTMNETHIITFNGFNVGANYAVGVVSDTKTNTIGTFVLSRNNLYIKLSASGITSDTILCMTVIGFTT